MSSQCMECKCLREVESLVSIIKIVSLPAYDSPMIYRGLVDNLGKTCTKFSKKWNW